MKCKNFFYIKLLNHWTKNGPGEENKRAYKSHIPNIPNIPTDLGALLIIIVIIVLFRKFVFVDHRYNRYQHNHWTKGNGREQKSLQMVY